MGYYIWDRVKKDLVTNAVGASLKSEIMRAASSGNPAAIVAAEKEIDRVVAMEADIVRRVDLTDRKKYAFVVPAAMFKGALRGGVMGVPGITEQYVKRAAHVFGNFGDFCEILSSEQPKMKEDIVQIGPWNNKAPQFRYRPVFTDWKINLRVRYIVPFLNEHIVGALLQYGGLLCGIGEDRPEKSGGTCGMFSPVNV
jgi:hypothetical protein